MLTVTYQEVDGEPVSPQRKPFPEGQVSGRVQGAEARASHRSGKPLIEVKLIVDKYYNGTDLSSFNSKTISLYCNFANDGQIADSIRDIKAIIGDEAFRKCRAENSLGAMELQLPNVASAITERVGDRIDFEIYWTEDQEKPGVYNDWVRNLASPDEQRPASLG